MMCALWTLTLTLCVCECVCLNKARCVRSLARRVAGARGGAPACMAPGGAAKRIGGCRCTDTARPAGARVRGWMRNS